MIRRPFLLIAAVAALALGAACTDDEDPTSTPTATATATEAATGTPEATETAEATATETATETVTETAEATPTFDPAPPADACAALAPEAADAAFVFVTNVTAGAYLESGDTVEGCSRTFESNVPWYLVDREGNRIAESFAMGGGVDGAASFEFVVEYEVAEAQVGHLFVGGDDPSDGEGFPPGLNQIPAVLLP